ncbi:MAG: class I SAM-dependent methyltransferase [Cytophagaceae bacterium]
MIDNQKEYEKIYLGEKKLWWYRILHKMVLKALARYFNDKEIHIVDAGCGTGGLIDSLREHSYLHVKGFDISAHALAFCRQRKLDVFEGDLKKIADYFPAGSADALISNDNLYFLSEQEQASFLKNTWHILKPGGILILNLPVLKAFRGTHDISVGIGNRFNSRSLDRIYDKNSYELIQKTFWPFLISPVIFIVRFFQRIKLLFSPSAGSGSDVKVPAAPINELLYGITLMENSLMKYKPWGSSLLVVLKKK